MKIVGLLSGEDEIDEMANIAKIFVVGERVKNLDYERISEVNRKEKSTASSKESKMKREDSYKNVTVFSVRGLT